MGAAAAVASVFALWRVLPLVGTMFRSLMVALAVGTASMWWMTPGPFVFAKLVLLGILSLLGYWGFGEFRHGEISVVRSFLGRKAAPIQAG